MQFRALDTAHHNVGRLYSRYRRDATAEMKRPAEAAQHAVKLFDRRTRVFRRDVRGEDAGEQTAFEDGIAAAFGAAAMPCSALLRGAADRG